MNEDQHQGLENSDSIMLRNKALIELHEALQAIPVAEKAAYIVALVRVPELIKTESDPLQFLRNEQFQARPAADRLVRYWRVRHELFGERAFLPLDLSGNGAMSLEDITVVQRGAFAPLSRSEDGPGVLFIDSSRNLIFNDLPTDEARNRRCFFCLSKFAQSLTNQAQAGIMLVRLDPTWLRSNLKKSNLFDNLINTVVPLQFKEIHIVCHVPESGSDEFLSESGPQLMKFLGDSAAKSIVHICVSIDQALEVLTRHGFQPQHLPTCFGGTWTYETDFKTWLLHCGWRDTVLKRVPVAAALSPGANSYQEVQNSTTDAPKRASLKRDDSADDSLTLKDDDDWKLQQGGLVNLHEAIQCIDQEDKADYLEALRRVPHLVEAESNPIKFLRFDKYNAWSAARRLVKYWKRRVEIFNDRAFLPLTHTGYGALTEEDIILFQSGAAYFPPRDSAGRTILFYTPGKRKNFSSQSRARVSFYVASIVSENDVSWKEGYVMMVVLDLADFSSQVLDSTMTSNLDNFIDCFPMQLYRTDLIYCSEIPGEKKSLLANFAPLLFKAMGRILNSRASMHVGSKKEVTSSLEANGIPRNVIPDYLGGSWSESQLKEWLELRRLAELTFYGQEGSDSRVGSASPSSSRSEFEMVEQLMADNPSFEKLAYLEAVREAPEVVQKDSDASRFLRFDSGDGPSAVRRMAAYWAKRKELFAEQAFLPLDQTGEGALDRKDTTVLCTCFLTQLPNDSQGRTVICCDGSRLSRSSQESRIRCVFYILSVASENLLSQTEGYVLIYVMSEPSFDSAMRQCLDVTKEVIPARMAACFLVGFVPKGSDASSYVQGPMNESRQALGFVDTDTVISHAARTKEECLQHLEGHGFMRDGLPKALGGNWGYEQFTEWQELRVRYEWELPVGQKGQAAAKRYGMDSSVQKAAIAKDEEEKNAKKRKMNVVHSRRKRERERVEVEGLREQLMDLQAENQRLQSEETLLEGLVAKAESMIIGKSTGDGAAAATSYLSSSQSQLLSGKKKAI